jgi:aerobic carbon-monoxide dehydrogenase medium subunit
MLLESVAYTRPGSIDEALAELAANEGAALLAGGQSLLNVLKNRVASVEVLVDISRLEELRRIDLGADGALEIGACVTYDELDRSPDVRAGHSVLADVAGHIEDQQIRNRGTIGGNCCLGDPTNNLPPILIALGAAMNVQGPSGTRAVAAEDFFHAFFSTAVEQGELLRSISVPAIGAGAGVGYVSLAVGGDAKAIVRSAAWVRANGTIEDARVALAVVGPRPIRHAGMEARLRGSPATPEALAAAAEAIGDDIEPVGDAHASAEYRRAMARVVARRAVAEAIERGAA